MLKTLYSRLSIALLALLLAIGIIFFLFLTMAINLYYEEMTQRLNLSIANHIVKESILFEKDKVNKKTLKKIAMQAMVINPQIEVYLLDTKGNILGHALNKKTIKQTHVDLKPIQLIINDSSKLPIKGENPREKGKDKIFSAARIFDESGKHKGYVYAILGGEKYENIATCLQGSYTFKLILAGIFLCLLFSLIGGFIIFAKLTQPLKSLTRRVKAFKQDNNLQKSTNTDDKVSGEINELDTAFDLMEERIHEQFKLLQQNDQTRRELISNVSHDLRTPLASMQGYIETLLLKNDQFEEQERKHYLKIARKHTVKLSRLIAELFELSKLDANVIKPNHEVFSLSELLYDIVQEFQLLLDDKEIKLTIESDSVKNIFAYADIGLMQRVFENLLGNAIRYTPQNGSIKIKLIEQKNKINIEISDTGCGISEKEIVYIFERFYHGSESPKNQSTGLGLAIVKRILDLHDSIITVKSQKNIGTTFDFFLPISKPIN